MANNKILGFAYMITRLALVITIIMGVITVLAFVYWHVSPESYGKVELINGFKAGYGISDFKIHLKEPDSYSGRILVSNLNVGSLYWLFFRAVFFITINALVLIKIGGIILSIKTVNIFYDINISNLNSIGKYTAVAALVSVFNFTIPWAIILTSLISFILAEVFKEGKLLLEDKNMIV